MIHSRDMLHETTFTVQREVSGATSQLQGLALGAPDSMV